MAGDMPKGDNGRMRHGGWRGLSEQLDAIHGQMHIDRQADDQRLRH